MALMQQTAATTFPTTFQFGNIRFQETLGSGAFGVVYKVQDPATSNFYALKSILCLNASALQNVVREAELLKQISHPNIIAILGTEQVKDVAFDRVLSGRKLQPTAPLTEHQPNEFEVDETNGPCYRLPPFA